MTTIKARKINTVPGDSLYAMTAPHTSTDGRRWPAGTEFRPLSSGASNVHDRHEATVTIGAERVTFSESQ